jgi:hypothetical protein
VIGTASGLTGVSAGTAALGGADVAPVPGATLGFRINYTTSGSGPGVNVSIYDQIDSGKIPKMSIPLRTKSNIRFDPKHGVFKYGKATGARTAKKTNGALMLLRTMYVLELIEGMIESKKSSTLREMYYISEGWDKAKFNSQDESNYLAEDLEIATCCMREDFKRRGFLQGGDGFPVSLTLIVSFLMVLLGLWALLSIGLRAVASGVL